MKAGLVLSLFAAATAWAAPPPCSPQVYPIKIQTAWVRVCESTLAAGAAEPTHTHSSDVVFLALQQQPSKENMLGGPPPQRVSSEDGDVRAIEVLRPYTHTTVNTGSAPARTLVMELVKSRGGKAGTQKPTGGAVLENSRVRVFRYTLQPGEAAPMHQHTRPYLIVSMTPMTLSMTDPQGRNFTHDVVAGDAHFQSTPVTHEVKNAGKAAAEVVEVEVK
ncbi:MAG TPA: hypothetical protein VFU76_12220 [Terriglobales bacterium]|nr:hypothetical protein [Terriglobales bacterium]